MWALLLSYLPGVVKSALEAYNKHQDTVLGKYKVDGTVDVAALSGAVALEQAKAEVLKAEQGHWFTRSIRPLMAMPVVIFLWKVIVVDKIVGPALGYKWATDAITGDAGVWVGLIIGGYFLHGSLMEGIRRWRQ